MNVIKTLVFILLGLLAVLLIGGYMLPSTFKVARSVDITAGADKIYALVAAPREWRQWSLWNQRDPAMAVSYSGPEAGAGAVWAWKSISEGDGRMSFTVAEPPQRVAFELYFPDFGTTSKGEFRFVPQSAGGTRVTWSMDGDMGANPLFHWMALFADGMVGKDFEAGLANLKTVAEKAP